MEHLKDALFWCRMASSTSLFVATLWLVLTGSLNGLKAWGYAHLAIGGVFATAFLAFAIISAVVGAIETLEKKK